MEVLDLSQKQLKLSKKDCGDAWKSCCHVALTLLPSCVAVLFCQLNSLQQFR
jgi:hypothetical protein